MGVSLRPRIQVLVDTSSVEGLVLVEEDTVEMVYNSEGELEDVDIPLMMKGA